MTNLTDKWKEGELPDNHHYYFKLPKSKEYEVGNTFCLETLRWCKDGDKIEVIEEVPSYKELITIISLSDILRQENAQLKELLKECKHIMSIEKDFASCHFEKDKLSKLCKQITELLGDK